MDWREEFGFGGNTYFSFILDPFILIGFAIFIVWLTVRKLYRKFGQNKWILRTLAAILLGLVWLGAGLLYFDLVNIPFLGEAGQGNYFMWNSGLDWLFGIKPFVDTTIPTYADFLSPLNILALFIFIFLYPLFLFIGIHIGYILFGRNEKTNRPN